MENSVKQTQETRKCPQYFAGIVAIANTVTAGCVFGWTSPALPQLRGTSSLQPQGYNCSDTEQVISSEQGSLIASLVAVGALVGSVPAGTLANILGRRRLTQAISLLLVIGWAIIAACSPRVLYLYVARLLHGMCLGIGSVVTPLYNEEIAEVSIRGSLGVLFDFALCLGILWVYLAGAVMPYLWMNISSALPALMSFVMLFLVPESPVHLLIHGEDEKAKAALMWLRGRHYDVQTEMSAMRRIVDKAKQTSTMDTFSSVKDVTRSSFRSPTAKSLFIVTGLMSARQLSGINAVTFYVEEILRTSGSSMDAPIAATLCALFPLGATVLMLFVADLAGRRVFLMVSCWGSAVSLVGLALGPPGWLPVLSVVVYISVFSVGLGPLPWFMMAELVPTEAKGWVTSLAVSINWLIMFLVTHFFVGLVQAAGTLYTYIGYATINILAGVGILLFVPETKGKTIECIQNELSGKQ